MLTAPTWTYSAAGGPNPFIVPARGGLIAAAINTESGATVVGLGRTATRFSRPLKLESRGVAIFAQPAPMTLPDHVWAIGYSTSAGVSPRLVAITCDGNTPLDVARPELGWREGRSVVVTETRNGPVLHIDDRHLVLDMAGEVVADIPRPGSDAPYAVTSRRLFAFDGSAIVCVDLVSGAIRSRIPLDGRPTALRADPSALRLAVRLERVLCSMDLDDASALPKIRAFIGGLASAPNTHDAHLRMIPGMPARLECLNDDGESQWSFAPHGATVVQGSGFFVGGETLAQAATHQGERVYVLRDGECIFERAQAGQPLVAGALARISERVAIVVSPGMQPSEPITFSTNIDLVNVRGGGALVFERPSPGGTHPQRLLAVDAAGALIVEIAEGGAGGRWAAASDGLLAIPRSNAARIDLYDTGAPA
ncbi:MAG: hypothetical protein Q8Q09_17260 [Deltaproteobacteria bacterium]|nr:hypothetical protein [Deltaproteobacteria bacterium]